MGRYMRILQIVIIFFSAYSYAGQDHNFYTELKGQSPYISDKLVDESEKGNFEARLELSEKLYISNSEDLVYKAEALLTVMAEDSKYVRLVLGNRYLEGVEIIPDKGKPKRILRNYTLAIRWLEAYIADPIANNEQLFVLAFTSLGDAYVKNKSYDTALTYYLNNIALVEGEPSGQAAYGLATLYNEGLGVIQNFEKAYYWYDVAAKKGLNIAIMERNFLSIELGK